MGEVLTKLSLDPRVNLLAKDKDGQSPIDYLLVNAHSNKRRDVVVLLLNGSL
jgi:hypothetical protein